MHSRTVSMAGFHLPADPYFPNQENNGWLEESEGELEEDPEEEEELEKEIEEGPTQPMADVEEEDYGDENDDDSDAESIVINPPYLVRVPAHRMGPNRPTPP